MHHDLPTKTYRICVGCKRFVCFPCARVCHRCWNELCAGCVRYDDQLMQPFCKVSECFGPITG